MKLALAELENWQLIFLVTLLSGHCDRVIWALQKLFYSKKTPTHGFMSVPRKKKKTLGKQYELSQVESLTHLHILPKNMYMGTRNLHRLSGEEED